MPVAALPIAIQGAGLLTAVGGDAAASCAAFRAKTTNPTPTRIMNSAGEWIIAHRVLLDAPDRGIVKLATMAVTVITEALAGVERSTWGTIPLLLCVAERSRAGRLEGLDDALFGEVCNRLDVAFAYGSAVVADGRVGVAVALHRARELIVGHDVEHVLIVAVDSLLNWETLSHYDRQGRLLTPDNSNGFMAGEGAGALLVGRPSGEDELLCAGIGIALEDATIDSERPLRADGLVRALRDALLDADLSIDAFDFRIADLSGEHYYFRECALALQRVLHRPKPQFDLWHPAECTGEAGSLAGAAIVVAAAVALRKRYAKGRRVLAHMSNDDGRRAACALVYGRGP